MKDYLKKENSLMKVRYIFGILLLYSLFISIAPRHSTEKENLRTWQKILNNNYGGFEKSLETRTGLFIAVGNDYYSSNNKIYVQQFTNVGDSIWAEYIGATDKLSYLATWIENTNDNGYIISGSRTDASTDAYIVRADSINSKLWSKIEGGPGTQVAVCVKPLSDGGFVVLLRDWQSSIINIGLMKLDSNGNTVWRKAYPANNNVNGVEVIESKNGRFYIIGWSMSDIYLMCCSNSGDTLWTKRYGSDNTERGVSLQELSDGGFILGGVVRDSNLIERSLLLNVDDEGNILWQRTYTAIYNELLFSVRTIPGRGYVFCGTTDSVKGRLERGFIRIIDPLGNVLTQKFFRALPYFTEIRSVEVTQDRGFIISGVTQELSGGVPKMYIARTDSLGEIKVVNIQNGGTEVAHNSPIVLAYPNPFNSRTIIKLELNSNSQVSARIFSVDGKLVARLKDGNLGRGEYLIPFEPSAFELSTGMYFLEIEFSGRKHFSKLIYLK